MQREGPAVARVLGLGHKQRSMDGDGGEGYRSRGSCSGMGMHGDAMKSACALYTGAQGAASGFSAPLEH